jgi:hypothetical protein
MAAADPLNEKVKNDTEVTADLAIFVAVERRDNVRWSSAGSHGREIVHHQGRRNAHKHG